MGEEENKLEKTKAAEKEQPKEPKKAETTVVEDKGVEKLVEEPKSEAAVLPEIVLRVFMHCEGCARKVRRSLKDFPGIETVITDTKSQKAVVKGEIADPLKIVERVQKKSHRKVELLSPIPKQSSSEDEKKSPIEEEKTEQKKQEIITVVLKVHMHCEACSQEIKRRILKMKGVESAEADLKNSLVSVKGAMEASKLVDYVYKRTARHAVIIRVEPQETSKIQEEKPTNSEEEKSQQEQVGSTENNKKEEEKKNKKEEKVAEEEIKQEEKEKKEDNNNNNNNNNNKEKETISLTKNEHYYYPPRHGMELYAYAYNYNFPPPPPPPLSLLNNAHPLYYQNYPPQMFNDENPDACNVM
ncbi:heavy metal-associated isoprenylated plant protein 4 [Arachis hypogaea]|uniref:heavy metal-associated isoprenylated plant protein 4 n=1 Tax=Arachis hypogaea TaxID=3818 RepID=UPI000DEDD264|nr:heavy metal-associated isoprenylated plant protein 7 [Arachis hypogaea]